MSGPAKLQHSLTLADLQRFLDMPLGGGAKQAVLPAEDSDPKPYLEAAAVLAAFDPVRLRPAHGEPDPSRRDEIVDRLFSLSEPIEDGPERGLWALSFSERRDALRRLGTRAAMQRALDVNPERRDSPVQRMFERVIGGSPIQLAGMTRDELAALLTVLDWFEGILDELPDRVAIRSALAMTDLLAPMQRLAGRGFVNRRQELEQLKQYVSGPEPAVPLFVFGPGGVGKSTLLARFILDHTEGRTAAFAYLDTDRPVVRPDRPLTYLIEMIAQLRLQLDLPTKDTDGLVSVLTFGTSRHDQTRSFESFNTGYGFSQYLELFADILRQSGAVQAGKNVVIVIDTFEEAQFLGSEVVSQLLDLAFEFRGILPTFRVILAGRALPQEFVSRAYPEFFQLAISEHWLEHDLPLKDLPLPGRPRDLGVLDEEGARDLLRLSIHAASLAPLSEDELNDVIGIVTSNPMCLKLAVRVLRNEGISKLREARSEMLSQLKAEKIQALLYGRILRHVHGDESVKTIAYPGLIVRRVTPEVIRKVLAKPCRIKITVAHNEYHIFDDLSKEAALMERDPLDDSLRHRADVRRSMLEDLTDHVDEKIAKQIDRAAVAFYAKQSGAVARAEEIYHRLRLRQNPKTLNKRWLPEAASRLKNAGEELPAQQRLWLAEKLGITLNETIRQTASQEAWEDQAARIANRFLKAGTADAAEKTLDVLRERTERLPRSQLYSLEAEAYRFQGKFDQALRVSRVGVEALSKAGDIDMALDLLLKMVVIEETRRNLKPAEKLLDEADAIAAHSNNEILQLRVQITKLRLQRQLRPEAHDEQMALRRKAMANLTDEMLYRLRSYPVLLRELAAELSEEDARISKIAIDTLGFEVATDAQAQALGRAITALDIAQTSQNVVDSTLTKVVEQFQQTDSDPGVIRNWVIKDLTIASTRQIGQSVNASAPQSEVHSTFQHYFRAGVDGAIHGTQKAKS